MQKQVIEVLVGDMIGYFFLGRGAELELARAPSWHDCQLCQAPVLPLPLHSRVALILKYLPKLLSKLIIFGRRSVNNCKQDKEAVVNTAYVCIIITNNIIIILAA